MKARFPLGCPRILVFHPLPVKKIPAEHNSRLGIGVVVIWIREWNQSWYRATFRVEQIILTGFTQNFHFAFPATGQYTPHRLRWGRFFVLSIPSDSGGLRRGPPCLFRVRENQKLPHFQAISQTPLRKVFAKP